jgi:hypothetical protein
MMLPGWYYRNPWRRNQPGNIISSAAFIFHRYIAGFPK